MSAVRYTEVVILCEDEVSGRLLRRYVERFTQNRRSIRLRVAPSGCGAGEQWVRNTYGEEVAHHRRCVGKTKSTALIVHVDADKSTVKSIHHKLEEALDRYGQARRGSSERIALVITKRNIETWIHGLSGMAVNENDDYSKQPREDRRLRQAAEQLFILTRRNAPPPPASMPSLADGIDELRRIETPP